MMSLLIICVPNCLCQSEFEYYKDKFENLSMMAAVAVVKNTTDDWRVIRA